MTADKPFTISAFPRSGTRYVACLLVQNGIPCTHEHYHPFHLRKEPPLTHNLVSSVVTDWAKEWRYDHAINLYLMRNPYEVIKSWPTLRQQHRNRMYDWFQKKTFEETWVASVEFAEKFSYAIYRVEDFENRWDEIVSILGYPDTSLNMRPVQRINSNANHEKYDSLKVIRIPEFVEKAAEYGYE